MRRAHHLTANAEKMVGTLRFAHPTIRFKCQIARSSLKARSPHERSDMRVHPGCRFAHPGYRTQLNIPAARCVRVLHRHHPQKFRGRREHRMLAAPASLACKEKCTLRTQAATGQPKQSGIPCAMVLRLITRSPRCPGFLAVEPQEVVLCQTESADRRLKIYAAMRPVPIVFV